jgi:hypothetical protein
MIENPNKIPPMRTYVQTPRSPHRDEIRLCPLARIATLNSLG